MYHVDNNHSVHQSFMNKEQKAERIRKMRKARRRQILFRRCLLAAASILIMTFLSFALRGLTVRAKSGFGEQTLYKYYKNIEIQPNDTLWTLAQDHYCDQKQSIQEYIAEVQNINHLTDDHIVSGDHIVLPYYSTQFIYY